MTDASHKDLTPLMRQYWEVKSLHPDKVLLFRMGDFFEMFHEDAKIAAPILGIALTSRNKKALDETPMCGVPHHSIAGPINKLLERGHKVAICDQIEDPKFAKGIVKRAVTRILTPGMVYDTDQLSPDIANYMACLDQKSLSCVDTSSGEAFYILGTRKELLSVLQILPIAELLLKSTEEDVRGSFVITRFDAEVDCSNKLPESSLLLLKYIESLGGAGSGLHLKPFSQRTLQRRMNLSSVVLRHLEVFSTYLGDKEGSFFTSIDRTKTTAGTRLLKNWLCFPLLDLESIQQRQKEIESWQSDFPLLKRVRDFLGQMGDLERRMGKVALPQVNARDLLSLSRSILLSFEVLKLAQKTFSSQILNLAQKIELTFIEDPPLSVKQGGMIRKGVHSVLDEWLELAQNSQGLLQKMEEEERQKTGISSLKIRYNNVFGYYIEITHTHKDKVPVHYMRKQTLANAERYCTEELIELEKKVLSAQARRAEIEFEIFENLKKEIYDHSQEILKIAEECSYIDVIGALAYLAIEQEYVKPEFKDQELNIKSSRHPVVEQKVKSAFVANDIHIQVSGCILLTGPNMAGKSTLMRQVALTSILAQIGSFVPASEASLPLFGAIYTRIGASDQLSEGLSTFMVEMKETAEMLKAADEKSLVILDEVGRGTSTFDGMALAQSLLEYLVSDLKTMTLFATHYHELTKLSETHAKIHNAHMSVIEKQGEIRFLHTLKQGPAQKSYGIQVAKIAGLPVAVTKRAEQILKCLEKKSAAEEFQPQMSLMDFSEPLEVTESIVDKDLNPVLKSLIDTEVANLTPLDALNLIHQWQKQIEN